MAAEGRRTRSLADPDVRLGRGQHHVFPKTLGWEKLICFLVYFFVGGEGPKSITKMDRGLRPDFPPGSATG